MEKSIEKKQINGLTVGVRERMKNCPGKKSLDKCKYNLTVFGGILFIYLFVCLFVFILNFYIPKINLKNKNLYLLNKNKKTNFMRNVVSYILKMHIYIFLFKQNIFGD